MSGCAALENRISIVPQSLASTPREGLVKLKSIGGCSNTAVDGESLVVVRTDMTGWSGILPGRHTISTGLNAVSETHLTGGNKFVEHFSSALPQSVTFEAVSGRQYILACEITGSKQWHHSVILRLDPHKSMS
jgi:hypothetical protein